MELKLSKYKFGKEWPFICDEVRIFSNQHKAVWIEKDGIKYNVNGIASNCNIGIDLNPIWKDTEFGKVNLGKLFKVLELKRLI